MSAADQPRGGTVAPPSGSHEPPVGIEGPIWKIGQLGGTSTHVPSSGSVVEDAQGEPHVVSVAEKNEMPGAVQLRPSGGAHVHVHCASAATSPSFPLKAGTLTYDDGSQVGDRLGGDPVKST
jgi:hypothetical protein